MFYPGRRVFAAMLTLLVVALPRWQPAAPAWKLCRQPASPAWRLCTYARMQLADDEDEGIADFRAQLMRQMSGESGGSDPELSKHEQLMRSVETAKLAEGPAAGIVLLADPTKFCSRNPFARPLKGLERFGLDGPILMGEVPPDLVAQMLPVVLVLEYGDEGSFGVLLERRTGALMGDIDIETYGCVAIAPLWLGGLARRNTLSVLHSCEGIKGAKKIREGIFSGGWDAARRKVADSSLAATRFKFYLGGITWSPGQLEEEMKSGAWIPIDASPEALLKERIDGSGSRRAKPVWTEMLQTLGEPGVAAYKIVYGD